MSLKKLSTDTSTVVKKILVGVIIFLVPFSILVGGLWLIQHSILK